MQDTVTRAIRLHFHSFTIYLVNVAKKPLHEGKTDPKSNCCGSFRHRKFDSNQQFANCVSTTHFSDTVTTILEFVFEIT